jgi:hypothetical protein
MDSDVISEWTGWASSHKPTQNLGVQLTLFQPGEGGGADYAPLNPILKSNKIS